MMIRFNTIHENDLETIMKWRSSPEVTKYMYTDPTLTMDDQLKWFNERVKNNPHEKYWIINVDSKNIGVVSIYNIDFNNQRASWAYYIGENGFSGKGIGKQVELNILKYVFTKLKLNKLCCEVFSFNEKVIEIHQKYGSKIEGVLRQHIFKNGAFFDVVIMGVLREDWIRNKDSLGCQEILIED